MKKIEIGEGCYGPQILIDGKSLYGDESGGTTKEEFIEIEKLQKDLIRELELIISKMDMNDFRTIAEIIISRGRWFQDETKSYSDTCDQCGNYNWDETYNKNKNEE